MTLEITYRNSNGIIVVEEIIACKIYVYGDYVSFINSNSENKQIKIENFIKISE